MSAPGRRTRRRNLRHGCLGIQHLLSSLRLSEPRGALAGFEPLALRPLPRGAMAGFESARTPSGPMGAWAGFDSSVPLSSAVRG
jgi:hypothetical protein